MVAGAYSPQISDPFRRQCLAPAGPLHGGLPLFFFPGCV